MAKVSKVSRRHITLAIMSAEGRTKHRNLTKLGIPSWKAWEYGNTRKGYWRIYNSSIVSTTLGNKYLEELGYKSITKRYQSIY